MITVTNHARACFVLNLQPGVDYGHPECVGTRANIHQSEAGGVRETMRTVPGALTWLPGEMKRKLPDAIQSIPEFKRAVAMGVLRIVKEIL